MYMDFLVMDGFDGLSQMIVSTGPIAGYIWPLHRKLYNSSSRDWSTGAEIMDPTNSSSTPTNTNLFFLIDRAPDFIFSSKYILWKDGNKWICLPARYQANCGHYIADAIVKKKDQVSSAGHYIGGSALVWEDKDLVLK